MALKEHLVLKKLNKKSDTKDLASLHNSESTISSANTTDRTLTLNKEPTKNLRFATKKFDTNHRYSGHQPLTLPSKPTKDLKIDTISRNNLENTKQDKAATLTLPSGPTDSINFQNKLSENSSNTGTLSTLTLPPLTLPTLPEISNTTRKGAAKNTESFNNATVTNPILSNALQSANMPTISQNSSSSKQTDDHILEFESTKSEPKKDIIVKLDTRYKQRKYLSEIYGMEIYKDAKAYASIPTQTLRDSWAEKDYAHKMVYSYTPNSSPGIPNAQYARVAQNEYFRIYPKAKETDIKEAGETLRTGFVPAKHAEIATKVSEIVEVKLSSRDINRLLEQLYPQDELKDLSWKARRYLIKEDMIQKRRYLDSLPEKERSKVMFIYELKRYKTIDKSLLDKINFKTSE